MNIKDRIKVISDKVESGIKIYGVIGSPLEHSLSPLMHNESFSVNDINAEYFLLPVNPKELEEFIYVSKNAGLSGLNVTIPHKESVLPLMDKLDPTAKSIGSVNTISFNKAGSTGYNTDVHGFLSPIRKYIKLIKYENVVIFGSGGAARAVFYGLLRNYDFPNILLTSRNSEKANILLDEAETWKKGATTLHYLDFDNSNKIGEMIWESKLVINCTPLGMGSNPENFPPSITRFLRPGQICYDLVYNPIETEFIKTAERNGAITVTGLDMFVKQGAKAFKIWTGEKMLEKHVKKLLENRLSANHP